MRAYIHTGVGQTDKESVQPFWLGKTQSFSCASDSNPRPLDLQSNALTTEPTRHPTPLQVGIFSWLSELFPSHINTLICILFCLSNFGENYMYSEMFHNLKQKAEERVRDANLSAVQLIVHPFFSWQSRKHDLDWENVCKAWPSCFALSWRPRSQLALLVTILNWTVLPQAEGTTLIISTSISVIWKMTIII